MEISNLNDEIKNINRQSSIHVEQIELMDKLL